MITIALDEQGDFENIEGKLENAPVFICGIIYDDNEDATDYDNEKKRLPKYLKNVCLSVECRYPQDLHYTTEENTNNGYKVARVKKKFSNTIKEYLEQGTWNNSTIISEQRLGKYYIFASLRGKYGKKKLLADGISEAVKDDFASNLYVHMAEDVIERLIFHNPIVSSINKIRLELATRRVLLSGEDRTERMKQYEQLGFKAVQREPGENTGITEYLLTNHNNYRTALEREMLSCNKERILIDRIGVKSIYYKNQRSGMDFLYLADAICSLLGFEIQGNKPSEWIDQFYKRSYNINGNTENIIWAYDEVDDYFSRAWKYLEDKDYYRALSLTFDGSKYNSEMTSFYSEKWFKYISKSIDEQTDASAFSMAVKKYRESLLNNNLNQEKLVYIFEHLEKMSHNIIFASRKDESELYDLYDGGLSAYIHNSNLSEAKICFEKIKQYAEYVATEAYLRTRNKMVVFLCDNLNFYAALILADENVTYHDLLSDMKKELFGESFTKALNHAIALSQRAQVYAFLNDEKAERDFLAALEIMDEGTPDRYITQSYLLHYYLCQGLKDKYEKLAVEYFGNKSLLIEQFNYIVKEGSKEKRAKFSMKYALYVYVKALYVFYLDVIPGKLLNKLKSIEKALYDISKKTEKQINGHPWEIIYKYLALIMISRGYYVEKDMYYEKLKNMFFNADGLIKDIYLESIKCIESTKMNSVNENKYTYMYC